MTRKMQRNPHERVIGVTGELGPDAGRDQRGGTESGCVRSTAVDISSELQVHSVQAQTTAPCCTACTRRLLPGETLHVYESGSSLCTLCAAVLPDQPLRRERIHASAMRLAVVPRAA
jgi:hypothetical protein